MRLSRSVQSLQRLQRIARVLTQHGFGHIVDQLDLGRFVPLWLKNRAGTAKGDAQAPSVGRRLRLVANELGPIFVKLGQMLATRPDILPPEILTELQTLQDRVAPFDSAAAMDTISGELGAPLSEAYRSIDDEPIASGSIGQVYRATLTDGRPVVIKVRRPNIEQEIRSDLQLLKWLAEGLERWVSETRQYHPCTLAEEFERALLRELDFMHEAATTARLREAFADDPHIEIPEVIWSHTTPSVLTLEALEGESLQQALDEDGARYNHKALAMRLADMYLRQFLEIGTFHADPHPGNILVKPPARIGLIDFGQFGVVSDALAGNLLILLLGAVHRDMDLIFDALGEMGALGARTNRGQLVCDLQTMVDKYHGQPLERLKISSMFNDMAETIRRHDVSIPRDAVLMLKSLATVWGVALRLDPELDLVGLLKPRLASMVRDRLSPVRALRSGGVTLWHLLGVFRSAPQQLREMLKQLSAGRWQVHIRHENLEPLGRDLDRSSNRMAFAIVIAGVVVGSSALVSADPSFQVLGVRVQVLGVIGYLMAAVLGMGLLWAIFRSGRLS
ncbi:MAG: AarF/UbiB family protein [Phycisphaerae bacterium]